MARPLKLYEQYSRLDARNIFDPAANYTKGAGLWGLQGIIPLSGRPGDFAFFVSFGRMQGDHTFDEGISTEGLLRWQSQPSQGFDHPQIKQFIAHDETKNSIYLFLRTRIRSDGEQLPYTYLGPIKYLGHDAERQHPVHFLWQLLEWPIPPAIRSEMQLQLMEPNQAQITGSPPSAKLMDQLIPEEAPQQKVATPKATVKFRATHRRYPSEAENKALGLLGEKLVLAHERTDLIAIGRSDLAELISHTAVEEGDGAGYDIRSYFPDGRIKYIEVKTTAGPRLSDFFVSANELAFSQTEAAQFELRRLYDYDKTSNSARYYTIKGDLSAAVELVPTQYRVTRLAD